MAEQHGLVTASQELWESAQNQPSPWERRYEVREIADGNDYRLYVSRSFLEATDLAFAVLHEWEPRELHVVCIADDRGEELCWRYPPID